jgi:hypothetical protein
MTGTRTVYTTEIRIVYRTSDGSEFVTMEEAKRHEMRETRVREIYEQLYPQKVEYDAEDREVSAKETIRRLLRLGLIT